MKSNLNWLSLDNLPFENLLSIRCYFIGEDGEIYVGKMNKYKNLFATNYNGSNKPAFKTIPTGWLPLESKLFPDEYFK